MILTIKVPWIWVAVLLLLVFVGVAGYNYYLEEIRVIPEELVRQSLENTLGAETYSYKVEVVLTVDGQEKRKLSSVTGQKSRDNFHIQGEMLGQQVEVFQVDDVTYSLDPKSGKWMVTPGNELFQPEIFMTEINPMANFRFTQVNDIQYHGLEKADGGKRYVVTCRPEVRNGFMEKYWQDFSYKLWIDKYGKRVVKAEVTAKGIEDERDVMNITLELDDFNKRLVINAPKQD